MGIGPILLFDKSLLQSLSVDESVWLDTFYFPCITPLFFVETLGDLEKEVERGRTPEDVVGNLADKTPSGGAINIYHRTLWRNELLGYKFELRHAPAVGGGKPVRTRDGRGGVVYDVPPEAEALERWQQHRFLEVEHDFAKSWREGLSDVDLESLFREGRQIIQRLGRPRDLTAARVMAQSILIKPGSRYVRDVFETLEPREFRDVILDRWQSDGDPPIKKFAPYTAHVFLVDLFFRLGLGADLIGRERATNVVDLAYLYYLPFCMAFTSSDKLHERMARALMDESQVFVPGRDMKADLAKLDEFYSRLPEEQKARGVMSFAHYPPIEGDFLVSKLWDKLMNPEWREWESRPRIEKSAEVDAEMIARMNEMSEAPFDPRQDLISNPDAVMVHRSIPFQKGKWQMLPREVLKTSEKQRK